MTFSKFNRVTHRDLGYLIAGLTIIYALSGIALNHKHDWNPNYVVDSYQFRTEMDLSKGQYSDVKAKELLKTLPGAPVFKASHFPSGSYVNIFTQEGLVQIDTKTGNGTLQKITKRPLFYEINFLHYNPGVWWKWFSDIFCVALILVTITGLLIIKGKNGITRRGAILTAIGIILPLLFLFIY